MSTEVEELQNIAISIHQSPQINVFIDNAQPTAFTDFKNIYVTIQLIPPELRKFRRVVSRILDGQVSHEAGHIVITAPVHAKLVEWVERQELPNIAHIVEQTIEDKRVNHYILSRYRFDFAFRLQLLADVSNQLWIDSLKVEIAKARNSRPELVMKPESFFLNDMLISIAAIKGLWNYDVEKEFDLTEEQKQFVNQTRAILEEARFDKMVMSVVKRCQQLYDLWQTHVKKAAEEKEEKNCPENIGGKLKLISGQATKKMLAKMEKKMKEAEEKLKEELAKERKRQKEIGEGMAAGAGSGLNIPTPIPDEANYQYIAQRNREHIERLLNLLKKLMKPKMIVEKWRKQGRIMTEILSKAYTSSIAREVDNFYARKVVTMEKAEVCIGLLVDLSGSVNINDAKDSLTTISEVCGRWLRDEDFAIMVFGGEFQKIKCYVEPYHTTKIRIGGMKCLGGTVLKAPLTELYQMMKAQRNGRAKILMIVSDFDVIEPNECRKLIKTIQKDGINVVGLGINRSNDQIVQSFCPEGKYIGSIRELPEAVFDLYRGVAT